MLTLKCHLFTSSRKNCQQISNAGHIYDKLKMILRKSYDNFKIFLNWAGLWTVNQYRTKTQVSLCLQVNTGESAVKKRLGIIGRQQPVSYCQRHFHLFCIFAAVIIYVVVIFI